MANKLDAMKAWWIVLGIVLFVTLFVPVSVNDGSVDMFWDCNESHCAWLIINAIFGIAMFVLTLIFGAGLIRGCIVGGIGLVSFILFPALASGGGLSVKVAFFLLFYLGMFSFSLVLAGAILRKHRPGSLLGKLLLSIAGGITAALFVLGVIFLLMNIRSGWAVLISFILGALINLLPVVAGILALVTLGKSNALEKLLKSIVVLFWVYIGCFIFWIVLAGLLFELSRGMLFGRFLADLLPILLPILCWLVYMVAVAFGFVEVFLGTAADQNITADIKKKMFPLYIYLPVLGFLLLVSILVPIFVGSSNNYPEPSYTPEYDDSKAPAGEYLN